MEQLAAVGKDIYVLGCGNTLFGDDGFGSHVVEHLLKNCTIPENVEVIDARTSVRGILFDMTLSEQRPRKIIVIDAIDANRTPGEVFNIDVDELPANKIDDFTFHQMPTSNLLKELKEFCGVEVVIVAAQVEPIPDAVKPGLSDAMAGSIAVAAEEVLKLIRLPCGQR